MATTVWKGHLAFGLVSIPVRLYKAARAAKVSFRQLYRGDASRIRHGLFREAPVETLSGPEADGEYPVDPAPVKSGEFREAQKEFLSREEAVRLHEPPAPAIQPIPRSEVVKGYEYDKDRYVMIEEEDIKRITPKTAREMQILEFVKFTEVDPVYLESSYYVAPDEGGEKPYALLFSALRESGYVGLAEVAMHNREHIVIVRPGKHGLLAHTMFYEDEIRKNQEFRTNKGLVVKKEMEMAEMLIQALAARFEPQKYKDSYREKLQALIAAKIEGKEVVEAPPPQAAPVVDIMEALRKSLAIARKPAGTSAEAAPKGKKKMQRRAGGR